MSQLGGRISFSLKLRCFTFSAFHDVKLHMSTMKKLTLRKHTLTTQKERVVAYRPKMPCFPIYLLIYDFYCKVSPIKWIDISPCRLQFFRKKHSPTMHRHPNQSNLTCDLYQFKACCTKIGGGQFFKIHLSSIHSNPRSCASKILAKSPGLQSQQPTSNGTPRHRFEKMMAKTLHKRCTSNKCSICQGGNYRKRTLLFQSRGVPNLVTKSTNHWLICKE